jgi:ubiquinone/menaquinone biosynthesis C-methylase UbiE
MLQTPEVDTSAAEAYEAFLVPGMIAPWARAIVSCARIENGMSVLDVACGTGIAARYAAHRCGSHGRVVGVDLDRGMLRIAASKQERLPIEYVHGSACGLPFESGSFDAVLCLQGLQYFPDRLKAMTDMRRVLRPGAPLIAMTWSAMENCKGYLAMISALERRHIDATAARKPFALASSKQLHSLAAEAGFEHVEIRAEQRAARFRSAAAFVDAMLQGAPSSRHALEKVPSEDWPGFLAEVAAMLEQWNGDAGLEFPMESHVLEARG